MSHGFVEILGPVAPPRPHPFAENAKGWATRRRGSGGGTWGKMYHYFQFRREEFLTHYHKRSSVESAFSMMKRKFGDGLRSKTDVAMTNETLCKVLCHNLVVLIHEMCELGIEPVFWSHTREQIH
jgi:hypothetical protein